MARPKRDLTPPASIEAQRQKALDHLNQGLVGMASEIGEQLIEGHPRRFDGYYILAMVAKQTSDFGLGLRFALKALDLSPVEEAELYRIVLLHATMSGSNDVAEATLDRFDKRLDKVAMLSQNPAAPLELRARYYERNGRHDEALAVIRQARARGVSPAIADMVEGRCLYGLKQMGDAVDMLTRLKDTAGYPTEERAQGAFQLSKLYDKQGDWDKAWQAAQDGHAVMDVSYSTAQLDEIVKNDTTGFTQANLNMWQRPSHDGREAIMISAMARSGTSLLEQILSMHPAVHPAGESGASLTIHRRLQALLDSFHTYPTCFIDMTQQEADRLQRFYFETVRPDEPSRTHTTDKSLGLFHRLGLIAVLLPGAKVISLRRHPLDNLLSCHMTQLVVAGHSYSSNLDHLAHYWQTLNRVTTWSRETFDLEWLDVSYEQLTHDQEGWTRKLVDHVGLPWNDACLQFHRSKRRVATISYDQVTQKMYTSSVERWRNYEKQLQPLIKALGKDVDEYDPGV